MKLNNSALDNCLNRIFKGDKNISISNMGHIGTQQKYLISLLSYLNSCEAHKNKKIALVSFQLEYGLYKSFFSNIILIHQHEYIIPSIFNADFINWNHLLKKGMGPKALSEYDLVLWDLPELYFIQNHSAFLEEYFRKFDSMLIVSLRPNGIEDVDHFRRIQAFYEAHGLRIPNLITEDDSRKHNSKIAKLFSKIVGF